MCPMLGEEDPEDIRASEEDYATLKKKGEEIMQEILSK